MGAGNSKPDGTAQHVFTPDAPVRFSSELIDSLQNSPQSDTTRSRALELQVQKRVERELSQLHAKEQQRLRELQEAIASAADAASSPSSSSTDGEPSLAEKLADSLSSADALAEKQRRRDMSRAVVEREIDGLRRKLEERRKLEQPDKAVEEAKAKVVECLRINDRRPLDCWREVEAFKREVGRLEKEFVERTVR